MKKHILPILFAFFIGSMCFAQQAEYRDSIQICYSIGFASIDHCVTIWSEDELILAQRICYSTFDSIVEYTAEFRMQAIQLHYQEKGIFLELDSEESKKQAVFRYSQEVGIHTLDQEKFRKQAILRHYQENNNYLVLDERVEISKSQLYELIKIIDEIKAFESNWEKGFSTRGIISYVVKDNSGTTVIIDRFGRYNRSLDIEKALGLKNYLRCPCVEKDIEQKKSSRRRSGRR